MKKDVDVVRVEKIVLNIKGNKIELSPDEAKRLLSSLKDALGDNYVWYQPSYPYTYTYPNTPTYIPSVWTPDVICGDAPECTWTTITIADTP